MKVKANITAGERKEEDVIKMAWVGVYILTNLWVTIISKLVLLLGFWPSSVAVKIES